MALTTAVAPTATAIPVRFSGWGVSVPTDRVTNADLESRMDTSDAWIVERTGIRERRTFGPGDSTTSLAVAAGREAIDRAGIRPEEVDLVIVATTTPDSACPATASRVQFELGTAGAAFDVNAACAGFVYALQAGAATLTTLGLGYVLVIGAERFTSIIDPADRGTAILFGDGAGAVLLGGQPQPLIRSSAAAGKGAADRRSGVLGVDLGGDGAGVGLLEVPPGERFLKMDGPEVFRRATRGMVGSCGAAMERAGVEPDAIALFVPHQANVRIIDAATARLGIDRDRVVVNLDRYGNTSAASVPMALAEAADAGRIHDGDLVLMCGIGAGMAWASMVLRWGA